MLKLILGELNADEGSISMPNKTSLGYLPQELKIVYTKTVYEEAASCFDEITELKQSLAGFQKELETRTDYESDGYAKLLENFSETQERLDRLGVGNIREKIEKILKGLGFMNGDFDRQMTELSGGWQMRVELAKLLLSQPSFILLDEPTNHLDIESIMWLERFLKDYPGGIVLISHDQLFLDHVTGRTVEIVQGKIYDYAMPYTQFLGMREERRARQLSEKKKQEEWIVHTKALIEKFRAKKNKAKFAQTLIRKLERVEPIIVDELETASVNIRFPAAPHSGKIVVDCKEVVKNYGTLNVLNKISLEVERGESIAFVGKNGEGKTTLGKIIAGVLEHEGEVKLGHQVTLGYFEQHETDKLDPKKTVFETIDDVATGEMRLKVRSMLGSFLFSGEEVDKKVMVLSGGEKTRLALAKMLLNPVNLMILDEPTNHLDLRSKEILKSALRNYNGSLIIVSHDREFLKGLTDKVYEFRDKKIKQYYGDIQSFLKERNISRLAELDLKNKNTVQQANNKKESTKKSYEQEKEIKRHKNKLSKCEKNISEIEKRQAVIEADMSDPEFYMKNPKANEIMAEYETNKQKLEQEMEQWEELAMHIEELEAQ